MNICKSALKQYFNVGIEENDYFEINATLLKCDYILKTIPRRGLLDNNYQLVLFHTNISYF